MINTRISIYTLLLAAAFLAGMVGFVMPTHAADTQFTISTTVIGNDVVPPSVPDNVDAVAVSTTQIDVSWDASTDNVGVTGYQVFRDNTQIATTTLLTYSDIGLTAATTYDYTVRAFDAAGNVSTSSATSSAATLSVPVESPDGGGNAYVPSDIHFLSFEIVVEETAATIRWQTSEPTRSVLKWGETIGYEVGSLSERALRTWHSTRITGLQPGVRYELHITATGGHGNEAIMTESFLTKMAPDATAPPNVRDFVAAHVGEDVILNWTNPAVGDFDVVRIIKGNNFYPVDPFDGELVFEGSNEQVVDVGAGATPGPHYYAAFAYDRSGNISSGAVTYLYIPYEDGEPVPELPETQEPVDGSIPLRLSDISFVQDGKEISFIGEDVEIDSALPLTISIPYKKVPQNLKTILVSIAHPTRDNQSFAFLLRIDEKKNFYTATIDALAVDGRYPITVSVFDYANRVLTNTHGTLVVSTAAPEAFSSTDLGFLGYLTAIFRSLGLWVLVLVMLLLLIVYESIRRDESKRHEVYYS